MKFFDSLSAQIGGLVLITTTLERLFPEQFWGIIYTFLQRLGLIFNPYVEITFDEFPPESHGRSKAYTAIQEYLGTNFSGQAARLKARVGGEGRGLALSMDDHQEVVEVYEGVKVSWTRNTNYPRSNVTISLKDDKESEKRAYVLSFRRKDRNVVVASYLSHVLNEGKAMRKRNRKQRLFTNIGGDNYWGGDDNMMWKSIGFEHPATFETLAMDPKRKKDIMDDLIEFTKSKDYYRKIGKPWKRGYLLYGPPGTGKSTMIAAIANFLHYDIYDLELTAVRDNIHLRKLMIEISKRAIIVIEDIDCSLDITGKREGEKSDETDDDNEKNDLKDAITKAVGAAAAAGVEDYKLPGVTLSGLLNFMDGLWSASGGERIFIFTTNHIEKLDEALIRRGRMDKHIELSYCCFEAFKVLAKNYLNLDFHDKYEDIGSLLSENEISTADVAEHLMPKSAEMGVDECLESLIATLQRAKEEEGGKREGVGF